MICSRNGIQRNIKGYRVKIENEHDTQSTVSESESHGGTEQNEVSKVWKDWEVGDIDLVQKSKMSYMENLNSVTGMMRIWN